MTNLNRIEAWWRGELTGLPLMFVAGIKDPQKRSARPETPEQLYTDVDFLIRRFESEMENHVYLADGYPSFDANLGPGSLALYLGSEPIFAWDTVWYAECIEDLEAHPPLSFDPDNAWWKHHYAMMAKAMRASGGRYRVNIPDLIENIDILAAMRGPMNTLYDIMDNPDWVLRRLGEIKDVYFHYYDAMYDLLKSEDGSSGYTAFNVQGMGRVAKVQCDFCAMLSPGQFRTFVLPSLQDQVKRLDRSVYHLDGPDAIKHVPALMELSELNALQWTCGAGQPDGGSARWFPIYDQVTRANKSLWIQIHDGGVDDWIKTAERLMERYDKRRLYFNFPTLPLRDAERLVNYAENHWK